MHTQEGVAETFINDVKEEIAVIMKDPESPVEGKVQLLVYSFLNFFKKLIRLFFFQISWPCMVCLQKFQTGL